MIYKLTTPLFNLPKGAGAGKASRIAGRERGYVQFQTVLLLPPSQPSPRGDGAGKLFLPWDKRRRGYIQIQVRLIKKPPALRDGKGGQLE